MAVTLDTVSGPTGILFNKIYAWSDAHGIRGKYTSTPFDVPKSDVQGIEFHYPGTLYILTSNSVLACPWDYASPDCSNALSLGGTEGAKLITQATGYQIGLLSEQSGLVASVPDGDGGTRLVLPMQPDDAGVLPVIAEVTGELVSLSGYEKDVYFTTTDGRLLRKRRDAPAVETLLSGLSSNALVAAADGQAFVANREAKQVLRVVP